MERDSSHPRFVGTDPASGRSILVVAEPGGALERLADVTAIEGGAALVALLGEIMETGNASDAELSAFVPTLMETLADVVGIAARLVDQSSATESHAARALINALGGDR